MMFYVLISKSLDVSSHRYHLTQSYVTKYEKIVAKYFAFKLKICKLVAILSSSNRNNCNVKYSIFYQAMERKLESSIWIRLPLLETFTHYPNGVMRLHLSRPIYRFREYHFLHLLTAGWCSVSSSCGLDKKYSFPLSLFDQKFNLPLIMTIKRFYLTCLSFVSDENNFLAHFHFFSIINLTNYTV